MEAISREYRVALSWELLHADDLAVIAETEEDNNNNNNDRLTAFDPGQPG